MRFEWDEGKSEANEEKHGIDFEEAKALWEDPDAASYYAHKRGEKRHMLLARAYGRVWVAIYTPRGEATRLISVRPASEKEAECYERNRNR